MLATFEKAAIDAGKAILEVYRNGYAVVLKEDLSPVTIADEKAEHIILDHLSRAFPEIPAIAEESVAAGRIPDVRGRAFFLVDPLDGTREFVEHRDEFTVNIAYIVDGIPVAGIVYAPALGVAFTGEAGKAQKLVIGADFAVSERAAIVVRNRPESSLLALASRCNSSPKTEAFLVENAVAACTSIGSSLKFCLLAEGKADVYPRFTRTMEWDTAAGDAVLRAAGGSTVTLDGHPLSYGKTDQRDDSDFANPDFICWGGRKAHSGS
jgi:3'(2'), 5'-bisphosphate nucleotidase